MSRRCVLVDDDSVFRVAVGTLLQERCCVEVVEVKTAPDAIEAVRRTSPDLVISGLDGPGPSGHGMIEAIRQYGPRVIVMSMRRQPLHVKLALDAGAHGYLLKTATFEQLTQGISHVMTGGIYLSPDIKPARETSVSVSAETAITHRQCEVLQLVAEGRTTREIAQVLGVSKKTVETHRASLMELAGNHSVAGLTTLAVRLGLTPIDG